MASIFDALFTPQPICLAKVFFSPVCVICTRIKLGRNCLQGRSLKSRGMVGQSTWDMGSRTASQLLLKSSDPRRLTQLKEPERSSPLPREPRKANQNWRGTSQRSPSNVHLAALAAWTGRPGVNHGPPYTHLSDSHSLKESTGARSPWGKRWHSEPALLGAALSTQLLPQEAGPEAGGGPTGQFPYPRPI